MNQEITKGTTKNRLTEIRRRKECIFPYTRGRSGAVPRRWTFSETFYSFLLSLFILLYYFPSSEDGVIMKAKLDLDICEGCFT